jgi:hypothetical protein
MPTAPPTAGGVAAALGWPFSGGWVWTKGD